MRENLRAALVLAIFGAIAVLASGFKYDSHTGIYWTLKNGVVTTPYSVGMGSTSMTADGETIDVVTITDSNGTAKLILRAVRTDANTWSWQLHSTVGGATACRETW